MVMAPNKACLPVRVRQLGWRDGLPGALGIVIGAGIFVRAGGVGMNSSNGGMMLLA